MNKPKHAGCTCESEIGNQHCPYHAPKIKVASSQIGKHDQISKRALDKIKNLPQTLDFYDEEALAIIKTAIEEAVGK